MRKLALFTAAFALAAVSFYGCDESLVTEPLDQAEQVLPTPSFDGVASVFPEGVQGGAIVQNYGQDPQLRCGWGGQYLSDKRHWVMTATGKEKLVCHFTGLPPIPKTFIWKGWNCVIRAGVLTANASWVRTPSGHATVTCKEE